MALATISIDTIDVGQRLRTVSEVQVQSLVASIGDVGLLNPITVYPCKVFRDGSYLDGFGIVAGAHRLEACKRLGLVEVDANVVTLDDLDRQIAECDENLCASSLSKSERAIFTKRRKDAYEAKHPETKNGIIGAMARHAPASLADASFTADTAAKTGQSERAVQRDAERGTKISERALDMVRKTRLDTGAYLDGLKAVPVEKQVEKVRADLSAPQSNMARRIAKVADEPLTDDEASERQYAALVSAWNKAGETARQRFRELIDSPIMDRRYGT